MPLNRETKPLTSTCSSLFYLNHKLIWDIQLRQHKLEVFANGLGDLSSVPGWVILKTQKMVLDASLLNTQHYKVRISVSRSIFKQFGLKSVFPALRELALPRLVNLICLTIYPELGIEETDLGLSWPKGISAKWNTNRFIQELYSAIPFPTTITIMLWALPWSVSNILFIVVLTFQPICPSAFFRRFMSNSGAYTEPHTEPFILSTRVDCSNSVNHDQVQVLSYRKYSLLFLPVVGIEPVTSRWFHSEAFSNQTPYPLHHVSLLNNKEYLL